MARGRFVHGYSPPDRLKASHIAMAILEQSLEAIPGIEYVLRGTLHDYDQHVPFILLGGTLRHGHSRTDVTPGYRSHTGSLCERSPSKG
jgi:hypothetical protein